jgi:hypothetical protein
LLANFKAQLELHNKISLSEKEFKQILNQILFSAVTSMMSRLREGFFGQEITGDKRRNRIADKVYETAMPGVFDLAGYFSIFR